MAEKKWTQLPNLEGEHFLPHPLLCLQLRRQPCSQAVLQPRTLWEAASRFPQGGAEGSCLVIRGSGCWNHPPPPPHPQLRSRPPMPGRSPPHGAQAPRRAGTFPEASVTPHTASAFSTDVCWLNELPRMACTHRRSHDTKQSQEFLTNSGAKAGAGGNVVSALLLSVAILWVRKTLPDKREARGETRTLRVQWAFWCDPCFKYEFPGA